MAPCLCFFVWFVVEVFLGGIFCCCWLVFKGLCYIHYQLINLLQPFIQMYLLPLQQTQQGLKEAVVQLEIYSRSSDDPENK